MKDGRTEMMPLRVSRGQKPIPEAKWVYHAVESEHRAKDIPFRVPGVYYQAFCGAKGLWWQFTKSILEVPPTQICKKCWGFIGGAYVELERLEEEKKRRKP